MALSVSDIQAVGFAVNLALAAIGSIFNYVTGAIAITYALTWLFFLNDDGDKIK